METVFKKNKIISPKNMKYNNQRTNHPSRYHCIKDIYDDQTCHNTWDDNLDKSIRLVGMEDRNITANALTGTTLTDDSAIRTHRHGTAGLSPAYRIPPISPTS